MSTKIDVDFDFEFSLLGRGVQLKKPQSSNSSNELKKTLFVENLLKLPMSVYFVNVKSEVQNVSQYCLDFVDLSFKKCYGKTIHDISPCSLSEQVIRNDQFILKTNQKSFFTEIFEKSTTESYEFLSFKLPWYDLDNRIIGVFGCAINMQEQSVAAFLNQLQELGLFLGDQNLRSKISLQFNQVEMTCRETTIINELIKGKTARSIAESLGLSKRTIESYTDNIKIKLGVSSKPELIELLMERLQKTNF